VSPSLSPLFSSRVSVSLTLAYRVSRSSCVPRRRGTVTVRSGLGLMRCPNRNAEQVVFTWSRARRALAGQRCWRDCGP
jgi:hypothetical protein